MGMGEGGGARGTGVPACESPWPPPLIAFFNILLRLDGGEEAPGLGTPLNSGQKKPQDIPERQAGDNHPQADAND
jgi:hypothetical protein